jgi:DNA ligase D-like protein (predicted 3'-phosphoesterase)
MSDTEGKLGTYQSKRDFAKTSEPSGGEVEFDWAGERPIFVIQKHQASTLHYDFRLEVDGVLASWAVPKGPSTDPSQRRLAVPTEDHPLAYADFEGVIPQGEYGGGTMLIWDRGSYRNLMEEEQDGEASKPVSRQIEDGHVAIWLEGQKLSGGYALVRTGKGGRARWLLIKMKDERADASRDPIDTEPRSVKSGRTMDEIREQEGRSEIG